MLKSAFHFHAFLQVPAEINRCTFHALLQNSMDQSFENKSTKRPKVPMNEHACNHNCQVRANTIPVLVVRTLRNLLSEDAKCPFFAECPHGLCHHLLHEFANEHHLARRPHNVRETQHGECQETLRAHTELFTKRESGPQYQITQTHKKQGPICCFVSVIF